MKTAYIDARKAAGYSRERAGVEAGTTSSTVRLFELAGPDAVTDPAKRGRLVVLYDRLRAKAAADTGSG